MTEVLIVAGDGRPVEDPRNLVPTLVLEMGADGRFRSGSTLLGRMKLSESLAETLKTRDLARVRIDLDEPEKTPASLVLGLIEQAQAAAGKGKRVEVKFAYPTPGQVRLPKP